ncbi:MAG TPA: phytanoyl-CoA dioxygenase family protein [Microlunatus sp.]|jgi:phytanoyl-CoA hydroxylase|nr:phytanoyl-CoA dioxygenase family protein [Microlunatus sp.]
MSQLVTERSEIAQRYAEAGVVMMRQLLSPAEVTRIRDAFTNQIESDRSFGFDDGLPGDDILARYPRIVHPHRRPASEVGTIALETMLDERILGVVTELIGPALAAQSMFYFKPPTARGQALHQDNFYLRAHPETCIAAWIAVDDCDADNGGLAVVPGSHRLEVLCPEDADPETSFTTITVHVPEGVEVVQTEMKAGDVLFFHGSVVHGSRPNSTTDRFRRSLIFHYIPEASVEVSTFFQPLLRPDGTEVEIDASAEGGPCGESWDVTGH